MLGLPKSTEVNKPLPKNAIYTKFQMNTATKDRIDADISRIFIVNEVTADKINLKDGETVKSFFVVSVLLKRKAFDERTLLTLSRLIPQNLVLVPEYAGEGKLMTFRNGKCLQTDWRSTEALSLEIRGLDLDTVWENVLVQIGGLTVAAGNTVDEQISIDEQKRKLEKEIDRLEKLARVEKQPKKKFELHQQALRLKKEMDV